MRIAVARILIVLNDKNPESDIGVNAERAEKQSCLSVTRVLTSISAQAKGEFLSLRILRLLLSL